MGKSRFNYVSEIDDFLPRLEKVQANFTLLAAGEIRPDEMTDESVKDLATLNLLIADLKVLKEDLTAESDGCQSQSEREKEKELHSEIQQLRQWVKELLPEDLKNKPEPKMKVSK